MACVRNTRKIYCANISRHAREKDIGHLFEDAGRIASLEHKGNFAFIEYENEAAAEHAIRRFHDHDFMGKRLIVKPYRYRGGDFRYNPDAAPNPAKFRGPRSVSYRLYITGLDDSTSWQDVKDFARTGGRSVCYTDVYTRHNKKEGVIEYYRREDFEYALRYLDRARLNGCRVRVFDRQPGGGDDDDTDGHHGKSGGRQNRSRSRSRDRDRDRDRDRGRNNNNNNNNNNNDDDDKERGSRDRDRNVTRDDKGVSSPRRGSRDRGSRDRSPNRGGMNDNDNIVDDMIILKMILLIKVIEMMIKEEVQDQNHHIIMVEDKEVLVQTIEKEVLVQTIEKEVYQDQNHHINLIKYIIL
eukprot:245393_1